VILKNKTDAQTLRNQFLNVLPSTDFLKQVYKRLCNYFQIPYGEGERTVHEFNFNDFCKTYEFNATITFNALQILDRNSIITLSQQFSYQAKLQFIISNQNLFRYLETNTQYDILVKTIMRTYGGIFENLLKLDLNLISDKSSLPEESIITSLKQLKKDGIVEFQFSNTDSEITLLMPREDDKTINRISKHVEQQIKLKEGQINAVIHYITDTSTCKNRMLLAYFGETIKTDCGICSVCLSKKKSNASVSTPSIIHDIIIQLEDKPLASRALIDSLNHDEFAVLKTLQLMIENNILELTPTNTYKIKHT
jgi:ATP-dependent DNA helicase RecQ